VQNSVLMRKRTLGRLAGAFAMAGLLGVQVVHVAAAAEPVQVVGCQAGITSLSANVQRAADVGEDGPPIAGSLPAPTGVSEDDSAALAPHATLSIGDAITAAEGALADAGSRSIYSVAVEGEQGFLVYSVKSVLDDPSSGVDPKAEVKVDAGNGDVLMIECDPNDGVNDQNEDDNGDVSGQGAQPADQIGEGVASPEQAAGVPVTPDQARAIALQRFPGATVEKVDLDDEGGNLMYSVQVWDTNGRGHDVEIDPQSGQILNVEDDPPGAQPGQD
jgi:uncharacterized membrane protein YkoI